MIRNIIAAVAAASVAITPVAAQTNSGFTGARVEATAGVNDIRNARDGNDVVYGVAVGIDAPVGDRFTIGIEGNTRNVFERDRQVGVQGRVGYAFTPRTLGYGLVGYNNYRSFERFDRDGISYGGGLEHRISDRTFVKAEYRYTDFEGRVGDSAVTAGVGIRF